ncbi:hypothetical protein DU976_17300 [Vibrio navarrensis]|nr:hypothetical protein [Vibrio navarrensis]
MDENVVGYLPCRVCQSPKKIIQGKGKRARFLRARCKCGPDCRTGEEIQAVWANHKTLEEVEAILNPVNETTPEPEPEPEQQEKPKEEDAKPGGFARFAVGGLCFLLGTVTARMLGANHG